MTAETDNEMRDLAKRVGDDLELEASFNADDWEPGETIPVDIAYLLDDDFPTLDVDAQRDVLERAIETWRDEWDGGLDVRAEVSVWAGEPTVNDVTIVLGTGGPHVEVTVDESGNGYVRAYGWFMEGDTKYPVSIAGHPLMSIVELTIERLEAIR